MIQRSKSKRKHTVLSLRIHPNENLKTLYGNNLTAKFFN